MKNNFSIEVLGKEYDFTLTKVQESGETLYRLQCKKLSFKDLFDAEDLVSLLASEDFKFFIAHEIRQQKTLKNRRIQIRVTPEEQSFIEKAAIKNGFKNTAEYVRKKVLT